jgi:hypothetical protein
VLRSRSWASVVSAPTVVVPASDVVLQSSPAAHVAQLQGYLERVESFLERVEATLSRLSLVPALLKTSPTSCPPGEVGASSTEDRGAELYGCFSPRVEDSSSPLSALSSVPYRRG